MPRYTSIPDNAHREGLRVRSYETSRDGAVRAGTVLRYLEHIATEASAARGYTHAWYAAQHTAWLVREMSLLLGAPAHMGDEIEAYTWLSEYRQVQAFREYALLAGSTGRLVARARGRWAYVNLDSGRPLRIPDEMGGTFGTLGHAFETSRGTTPAPSSIAEDEMRIVARDYEADVNRHINNCVYADWLDEGLRRAAGAVGAGSRSLCPRSYRIEYLREVRPGETILVRTRVAESGRRGVRAWQEIARATDGMLVARASSLHLVVTG